MSMFLLVEGCLGHFYIFFWSFWNWYFCVEGRILRPTVLIEVCMTIISEVMVICVVKNNGHLGDTLSYSK